MSNDKLVIVSNDKLVIVSNDKLVIVSNDTLVIIISRPNCALFSYIVMHGLVTWYCIDEAIVLQNW